MTESNSYFVFAGDDFYPAGGINDYLGCYASVEDATESLKDWHWDNPQCADWAQIAELDQDGQFHIVRYLRFNWDIGESGEWQECSWPDGLVLSAAESSQP